MSVAVTREVVEERITDALVEFGTEREELTPDASVPPGV